MLFAALAAPIAALVAAFRSALWEIGIKRLVFHTLPAPAPVLRLDATPATPTVPTPPASPIPPTATVPVIDCRKWCLLAGGTCLVAFAWFYRRACSLSKTSAEHVADEIQGVDTDKGAQNVDNELEDTSAQPVAKTDVTVDEDGQNDVSSHQSTSEKDAPCSNGAPTGNGLAIELPATNDDSDHQLESTITVDQNRAPLVEIDTSGTNGKLEAMDSHAEPASGNDIPEVEDGAHLLSQLGTRYSSSNGVGEPKYADPAFEPEASAGIEDADPVLATTNTNNSLADASTDASNEHTIKNNAANESEDSHLLVEPVVDDNLEHPEPVHAPPTPEYTTLESTTVTPDEGNTLIPTAPVSSTPSEAETPPNLPVNASYPVTRDETESLRPIAAPSDVVSEPGRALLRPNRGFQVAMAGLLGRSGGAREPETPTRRPRVDNGIRASGSRESEVGGNTAWGGERVVDRTESRSSSEEDERFAGMTREEVVYGHRWNQHERGFDEAESRRKAHNARQFELRQQRKDARMRRR